MESSGASEATESTLSAGAAALSAPSPTSAATVALTAHSCPTCGASQESARGARPSFVYAIGNIAPRFPDVSVEKQFAQATGRDKNKTIGLTDRQALHAVLSKNENRYLVRLLCWVMTIEGLETYILRPRDPRDFDLLVETLRSNPSPLDLDVVIGTRGSISAPEVCNGLLVPIVAFDQIYSFDRDELIKALPRPEKVPVKEFTLAAEELLDRIMQMIDNAGAIDEHRALNYLGVRYHAIYSHTAEAFARNESLTGVEVRPSPLSGTRNVVEVVFSYTNRSTDVVAKSFVRVDVTDEFPFLVTKLSQYYDR
jgi:hypothetical protein